MGESNDKKSFFLFLDEAGYRWTILEVIRTNRVSSSH